MRLAWAVSVLFIGGCSTIPTREKSSTPPTTEPTVTVQPDPEPPEGGAPFGDAGGPPPFDAAGCPDAMPEAGADCPSSIGPFDCRYVEKDGGELRCTCVGTPEGTWWSCGPPS